MDINARILIVDDNKSIHDDFRKVLINLKSQTEQDVDDLESELFATDDDNEDISETEDTSADVYPVYEVDSAYQGQDALAMIQQAEEEGRPYALTFMDVRMPPGWDGVETISRIWLKYPYIEMVLCTAYSDYSWDEIVTKLGATDKLLFLRKPFDSVAVQQMSLTLVKKWNLGLQARNYVGKLENEVRTRTLQLEKLLSELEQKNENLTSSNKQLKHVSLHDSLTKLPNRELFHDRLSQAIKVAEREKSQFSVFLIDVDDFKKINDTYGHLAGDAVLYEIGERLSLTLRSSDTVARLGGDEFALVLLNSNSDAPTLLAEKIVESMKQPLKFNDHSIDIGLSIGIAQYPDEGTAADELLSHADNAMYDAKSAGIGFSLYDADRSQQRKYKEKLQQELATAIESQQLFLHYQPILNLQSNVVDGVEALVRWQHPEKGLIPPDQFIPLAEHNGLIQQLTGCVLDMAFEQCKKWHNLGYMLNMSVNLSPNNFRDSNLANDIVALLNKWDLAPRWVKLEITENMTMENPEKALQILTHLAELGMRISIDDFGTGYSSLSYLKRLPVTELKIDKSFVMEMHHQKDNNIIVKSTVNLARELDLCIVAEGVESEIVLEQLKEMGCTMAQGFYMCKPQTSEAISQWLLDSGWNETPLDKAEGEN